MTWFRTDDGWHKHRKRIRTGMDIEGFAARGLWLDAGTWCADELTDGWVPDYMLDYLAPGIGRDLAKRLERAGLWEAETRDGEDGWQFHEWTEHQPTREEVLAQRDKKADGGKVGNHRRWHVAKGVTDPRCAYCRTPESDPTPSPPRTTDRSTDHIADRSTDSRRTSDRYTDRTSDRTPDQSPESGPNPPDPARPDPTRPGPIATEVAISKTEDQTLFPTTPTAAGAERPTRLPDTHRFDEFWDAYPHKRDKDAGRKAWTKVVRESQRPAAGFTLDEVIAAAGHYRFSKEFVGGFPKFPATFLNKGSWRDFAAGPPPEVVAALPGAARGFDAKAAGFDALREQFRHEDPAAALIRPPRHELTRGDTHA